MFYAGVIIKKLLGFLRAGGVGFWRKVTRQLLAKISTVVTYVIGDWKLREGLWKNQVSVVVLFL